MLTDTPTLDESVIACDPNAVPVEQRGHWIATGKHVYASVQAVEDLPDGYRFRLPTDSAMLIQVADYISNERLCCAFLHFAVEVEPNRGPFWLHLTGGPGVKDYIRSVFATSDLLSEDIAKEMDLKHS